MATLFDDRERAAEYGFAHDEELRFLAIREAVEAVAGWVAEVLSMDEATTRGYVVGVIDRLVGGAGPEELQAEFRRDLEAGGHAQDALDVPARCAQAMAAASDRLHGRVPPQTEATRADPAPAPHPHGFWGWTV